MSVIGEFLFSLGFKEVNIKNLDAAEKKAKESAKAQAKAFEDASKRVQEAEDALAKAVGKEAKAVEKEKLRIAKREAQEAKKQAAQAHSVAREISRAYAEAYRKIENEAEKARKKQENEAEKARKAQEDAAKASADAWRRRAGGFGRGALGVASSVASVAGLGGVVGLGGAGVAGIAAAGVAHAVSWSEAADEIAKTSKKLNVPADSLQRLRFAAEQSGVSFEALTNGIKTSNKLIAEGRADEKAPIARLAKALKLDLDDLAKMNVEDRFGAIADALSWVTDENLRARAQLVFFGEEAGVQLTPLLQDGAQAIHDLGDELEDLGGVISDEGLEKAEAFQTQLSNVKRQVSSVGTEIAVALMPELSHAIDGFSDWTKENETFLKQDMPKAIGATAEAVGLLAQAFVGAVGGLADLRDGLRRWQAEAPVVPDMGPQSVIDAEIARARAAAGIVDEYEQVRFVGAGEMTPAQAEAYLASQRVDALVAGALVGHGKKGEVTDPGKTTNAKVKAALKTPGGGSKDKEAERKKKELAALTAQLREDTIGDEIERLARKLGVRETGINTAIEAAAKAYQEGATESVARNAALQSLGNLSGKDLVPKKETDPLLSAIFDNNVPDAEYSMLARGTDPQVLTSVINNTFNFDNDFQINGVGSPQTTATETAAALRDYFQGQLQRTTKLVKVNFAR